jgi:hypothetical protein
MWPKSIMGLFLGLFLSMSLVLNINLVLPLAEDVKLISGLVIAFPIWAGTLVWTYAYETALIATKRISVVLVPSILLNVALLMGQ